MAITGLGLLGFTATHLLGNLLILAGPDAFNYYAHQLVSNKLIYLAEAGLAGMFVLHIVLAAILVIQNKGARSVSYYAKTRSGRGETIASATMPYTGFIILIFLIIHLITFKYGSNYPTTLDGVAVRDIYRTVIEYFANPGYVVWYVFAMIVLGIHTSHGFQSTFQSLGFNHPKYTPIIKGISFFYGVVIAVGFSALAIYSHFQ